MAEAPKTPLRADVEKRITKAAEPHPWLQNAMIAGHQPKSRPKKASSRCTPSSAASSTPSTRSPPRSTISRDIRSLLLDSFSRAARSSVEVLTSNICSTANRRRPGWRPPSPLAELSPSTGRRAESRASRCARQSLAPLRSAWHSWSSSSADTASSDAHNLFVRIQEALSAYSDDLRERGQTLPRPHHAAGAPPPEAGAQRRFAAAALTWPPGFQITSGRHTARPNQPSQRPKGLRPNPFGRLSSPSLLGLYVGTDNVKAWRGCPPRTR